MHDAGLQDYSPVVFSLRVVELLGRLFRFAKRVLTVGLSSIDLVKRGGVVGLLGV